MRKNFRGEIEMSMNCKKRSCIWYPASADQDKACLACSRFYDDKFIARDISDKEPTKSQIKPQ